MLLAAKILFTLILSVLAAWSVFGFLAAGELGDESTRLAWRIGYSTLGIASLAGITWLFLKRRKDTY